MELLSPILGSIVRWLITLLAAHGVTVAGDAQTQLLNGLLALAAIAWSVWQKYKASKK